MEGYDKIILENRILDLKSEYVDLNNILSEIWVYHPSNPNFINPITVYNNIFTKIKSLENRIVILENELSSLN